LLLLLLTHSHWLSIELLLVVLGSWFVKLLFESPSLLESLSSSLSHSSSHTALVHLHISSWFLLESAHLILLVAVLPLLGLHGILHGFGTQSVFRLSQLFISMCEVALDSKCAIFMSFEVPASFGFVFFINLIWLHRWLFRILLHIRVLRVLSILHHIHDILHGLWVELLLLLWHHAHIHLRHVLHLLLLAHFI
jgi:hypothetical protein